MVINTGYWKLNNKLKASQTLFWKTPKKTKQRWLENVRKGFNKTFQMSHCPWIWKLMVPLSLFVIELRNRVGVSDSPCSWSSSLCFLLCRRLRRDLPTEKWICTRATPPATSCACPSWAEAVWSGWCRWWTRSAAVPSPKRTRTTSKCLPSSAR